MKHTRLDPTLATHAALYALGMLAPTEAASYRAHLDDCAVCARELAALDDVVDALGMAAEPMAPPPALRGRLLEQVATAPSELPAFHFVGAGEGRWVNVAPGILRKDLAPEPGTHSRSYFIRMDPGAVGSVHTHGHVEHCLVVEGDFQVAGRKLRAGDYHRAGRGSTHVGNRTVGGCLLLLVESDA